LAHLNSHIFIQKRKKKQTSYTPSKQTNTFLYKRIIKSQITISELTCQTFPIIFQFACVPLLPNYTAKSFINTLEMKPFKDNMGNSEKGTTCAIDLNWMLEHEFGTERAESQPAKTPSDFLQATCATHTMNSTAKQNAM
jgi:hypothetical protein